jgi:hypothetical protein
MESQNIKCNFQWNGTFELAFLVLVCLGWIVAVALGEQLAIHNIYI